MTEIKEKFIEINSFKIFCAFSTPNPKSTKNVLLLHGMRFTSKNWLDIKTLESLSLSGFNVFAVDLPGFGKSQKVEMEKSEVLKEIVKKLNLENLVIVSPSMSGTFSIPFILKHPDLVKGFVPVAPVINGYHEKDFENLNLPTLIVYGEKDKFAKTSNKILSAIPKSVLKMIPDGSHPCYLDNPELFHQLITDFIKSI